MELASKLITIQERQEWQRLKKQEEVKMTGTSTYSPSLPPNGGDIQVMIGGQVIGRVQSIDATVNREETNRNGRIYHGEPIEASFFVHPHAIEILRDQLPPFHRQAMNQQISFSYGWQGDSRNNREERRTKPVNEPELTSDQQKRKAYRESMRKMLGGPKKWN